MPPLPVLRWRNGNDAGANLDHVDAAAADHADARASGDVREFEADFPTGQVLLGDLGVNAVVDDLRTGPGRYRVRVTFNGRDEAAHAAQTFLREHAHLPPRHWR